MTRGGRNKRRGNLRKIISEAIDSIPMELFTAMDMYEFVRSFPNAMRRTLTHNQTSRIVSEFVERGELKRIGRFDYLGTKYSVYVRTRDYPSTFDEHSYSFLYEKQLKLHPQDAKWMDELLGTSS